METESILTGPNGVHANNTAPKLIFAEHTSDVEEIVSGKPPHIVRWGTVYFAMLLAFVVAICWIIRYPDIVVTSARLTSINAPKEVLTRTSGKLVRLFAKENEFARQGAILGFLESNASYDEVIALSATIDSTQSRMIRNDMPQAFANLSHSYKGLGELQEAYQVFQQAYANFRNYVSGGLYLRKKAMLFKDMSLLLELHKNLLLQKDLFQQDADLSQKTLEVNQSLKKDTIISEQDYRVEKSKYINKQLALPQVLSGIINNESLQNEKQKEIEELENSISQQKSVFIQALNTLKSQVDDWKRKYLLISPISGKVAFATFLQENQQLQMNQVVCFVNPGNAEYYAEVYIPQANFGKVRTGQEVLLKFASYPFPEYGSVRGKIDFISNISTDSGYLAKVILPNGLVTNYRRQVQFRQGLLAQGEIITHDLRLLERFYYGIAKGLKK
ncbi:HlyD family secretion protein [Puia dinghuensis]|uniref:Hemolysin n=1 Tax=Puia dinghuensis TaxID=1792502 RepID=A0A8J2UFV3_9BACT|nr:HlyD family efflux transporter periplasmic adaptor subunit [Puia dinghuensis]GGB11554.1 hemolysin [Puia dinghuensis]